MKTTTTAPAVNGRRKDIETVKRMLYRWDPKRDQDLRAGDQYKRWREQEADEQLKRLNLAGLFGGPSHDLEGSIREFRDGLNALKAHAIMLASTLATLNTLHPKDAEDYLELLASSVMEQTRSMADHAQDEAEGLLHMLEFAGLIKKEDEDAEEA